MVRPPMQAAGGRAQLVRAVRTKPLPNLGGRPDWRVPRLSLRSWDDPS